MKMIRVLLFILAVLVVNTGLFAQEDIIAKVRDAIKTGSSREMTKYLNNSVDMTIEGKLKSYSKAQAEFILKDFFKKNPPTSFTIVHQGASKSGLPYVIGEYVSEGSTFRVWVRIRKINEEYFVHEVSFIKE